jgi:CheY-like chemotaxis protein
MKKRVLIVDNKPNSIVPVQEFLESQGFEVISAGSFDESLAIAAKSQPDVAILDLRLIDDRSPLDFSGIQLARSLPAHIPKIILTAYPSVQAVRRALGPAADGLPAAIGFLRKTESLQMLLRAVRLALTPENHDLLRVFEVSAMHALPERVIEIGADAAAVKIGEFIAAQKNDFSRTLERQAHESADNHRMVLCLSGIGFTVIVLAIVLGLFGKASWAIASAAVSLIPNALNALFIRRYNKMQESMRASFQSTQELMQMGALLELCYCFETPAKRDQTRQVIFDLFMDRLSTSRLKEKARNAAA